jgi:Transposase DDE domain
LRLILLVWAVPDFSTLSRRQKALKVNMPHRGSGGPLHLLVDSTGMKVEGKGEWNARKHGGTKGRVWRKIHIGIDKKTMGIRAAEFTTSDIGEAPMLGQAFNTWRGHPRSFLPSTPPRTTAVCAPGPTR